VFQGEVGWRDLMAGMAAAAGSSSSSSFGTAMLCGKEEKVLGVQKAPGSCPYCGGGVAATDVEAKWVLCCLPALPQDQAEVRLHRLRQVPRHLPGHSAWRLEEQDHLALAKKVNYKSDYKIILRWQKKSIINQITRSSCVGKKRQL
jgi:hypothetical protein